MGKKVNYELVGWKLQILFTSKASTSFHPWEFRGAKFTGPVTAMPFMIKENAFDLFAATKFPDVDQ